MLAITTYRLLNDPSKEQLCSLVKQDYSSIKCDKFTVYVVFDWILSL